MGLDDSAKTISGVKPSEPIFMAQEKEPPFARLTYQK